MSQDRLRKINELLGQGEVSRIAAEARLRRDLVGRVRAALPEAEADHVVSARLDDADRLVVGMDSSAWAAKLRYAREELLGYRLKVRVTAPGNSAAVGRQSERSVDGSD